MSNYYNHKTDSMNESHQLNIKHSIKYLKFDLEENLHPISNIVNINMILSTRDNKGNTPLMQSITYQNQNSFNFIIQSIKTANKSEEDTFLNERNVYGHTALHLSLLFRNRHMLQELIEIGCNPLATDMELKNAYHYIAENNLLGFTKVIHQSLLTYKNTGTELTTIREIEAKLLSSKDSEGLTPINLAIERQHSNILSELMDYETKEGGMELRGNEECILIKTGKCQSNALCLATNTENIQLVEHILLRVPPYKKNDFINEENGQGNTALHIAVAYNNFEIVKTLLRHGASLEVINAEHELPIDYCDSEEMKVLLLSHLQYK